MARQVVLTTTRRRLYEQDARTIQFYRNNPSIAVQELFGIYLSDIQNYMLASSFNAEKVCWSCSRNFGKSFLICVFAALKAILYPNQNIYIISSVGNQAKETFTKLEEIALRMGRTAQSAPDLTDVIAGEIETSPKNATGFSHDPAGYSVKFHNGSKIVTLNSQPDSTRGRRASLVIYDEAAFIDDALITATLPFISQSSDAEYGANTAQRQDTTPTKPSLQALYASSQDTVSTTFYKRFKEYAMYMIAGDRRFFCIDAPCDLAMTLYHKGEQIPPLLSKSVVESELKSNPEKAMREYYNKPDLTGGTNQIIKWNVLRNNERQIIPYSDCRGKKIVLAFDPARTADNSIVAAMELEDDPEMGICGNIIGCTNLIDITSSKKLKLDSNRQLTELRNIILGYNGDNPDYEYLDSLLVDAGAGGGGVSAYSDNLLNDFTDSSGRKHRGLIDASHEIYSGYRGRYPDAVDKLRLISPRKYRTQMVEEFIELMGLGVIRFPYAYNGQDFLKIIMGVNEDGEEILETYELSQDEKISLTQIDLMKTEITSIHKSTNAENTSVQYALAPDKRNSLNDDRFYCIIMLARRLYELRRGKIIKDNRRKRDISQLVQFRAPKIL